MKPKAIILLTACWLSSQAALAQPWVAWMRLYQLPVSNSPTDGALDPWGNIVAFGHDPHQGRSRATIIKYRPNGEMAWLRRHVAQGGYSTSPYKIRIDREGGILISTEVVKANEEICIELAKYDKDGNLVWRLRYDTGHVHDTFSDMALDQEGNVYVTGDWHTFDVPVSRQAFAIKVSSDGQLVWETRLDYDWPYSRDYGKIAVSNDGALVGVAANLFLGYDELRRALGSDTVVWRLDGSGNIESTARLSPNHATPRTLTAYGCQVLGDAVVSYGIETLTWNNATSTGTKCPWVAAIGPSGSVLWRHDLDFYNGLGTGAMHGSAIVGNDALIITGFVHPTASPRDPNPVFTMKVSSSGHIDWNRFLWLDQQTGGGRFVALDLLGGVIIGGGSASVLPASYADFLTFRYDRHGREHWLYQYDGPESNYDNLRHLAVDDRGAVYLVGGTVWDWNFLDDWITIKLCQRWGDANDDGIVNLEDLTLALENFGSFVPIGQQGDVTDDGFVDDADLALVLWMFGTTCP